jgi:hypothetical protein
MLFWNETDFIVPINKRDLEHVNSLKEMGFEKMPQIENIDSLTLDNLTT